MNIPVARKLRKNSTDAERRLWSRLRHRGVAGHRFRRQSPIGPYVVDFVCPEKSLVIEVDGGQHAEREAYDFERTQWLESQGYRVLRFWNNDVLNDTEVVLEVIFSALRADPPP